MIDKINYKQAVNLLAAYLGCNIKVDKPTSLNYFRCQVHRMIKVDDMKYEYILIAEHRTWTELLDSIIPLELCHDGKRIDYNDVGAAGRLYQYRYIGKTLKGDSR